jgi:hypothetical protein
MSLRISKSTEGARRRQTDDQGARRSQADRQAALDSEPHTVRLTHRRRSFPTARRMRARTDRFARISLLTLLPKILMRGEILMAKMKTNTHKSNWQKEY